MGLLLNDSVKIETLYSYWEEFQNLLVKFVLQKSSTKILSPFHAAVVWEYSFRW